MTRTIFLTLTALALLLVAAALVIPLFLDKERVVAMATEAVEEQTGAKLAIGGDIGVSLFPRIGVSFTDASLTMPSTGDGSVDRAEAKPDLEIGSADIAVQLYPLFSGEIAIDAITINGLTARLVSAPAADPVNTSNFTDQQLDDWYSERRQSRASAGQAAGAEAALAVPMALNVSALTVTNARLENRDLQTGDTSVVLLQSLRANDLNLAGSPIPLALQVRLPTGQSANQPIDVSLKGAIALAADNNTLTFNDLQINIDGVTAQSIAVVASGKADLQRQAADLSITLGIGPMQGEGNLRYASFESPMIDANLDLNLLDPVLLALAGPGAATTASSPPATDKSAPASGDEPLPLDAIRAIDTRAVLQVDEARFDAHTVYDLALQLRAVEGLITVSKFSGRLHDGILDATATLDGRHNTARLQTRGAVQDLDIGQAVAATGSPDTLAGNASLNWQLSSQGRSVNGLTAALTGPVTLATDNVVLKGISAERLVCQAVALTNNESLTSTFAPDTQFTALSANIDIEEGRARLRPLRAELAHIALSGSGNIDLLAQDFDATFLGRLSPGLEELDRACRVSKRLTAIDFPINCRGNVAGAPGQWCKVDTEKIVQDLAVNEGRRQLQKEAGKLFNRFLGGKNDNNKNTKD